MAVIDLHAAIEMKLARNASRVLRHDGVSGALVKTDS
jgi:hypothetical protein